LVAVVVVWVAMEALVVGCSVETHLAVVVLVIPTQRQHQTAMEVAVVCWAVMVGSAVEC
jgi:hypothetical protein